MVPTHLSSLRTKSDDRDTWEPLSPWCMLKADPRRFGRRIHPDALASSAELFLVNGDLSAWLYTGSQVRQALGRLHGLAGAASTWEDHHQNVLQQQRKLQLRVRSAAGRS